MYVAWRPGRDSLRRGRRQEETLGGRPELASGPKLTNSDGGPTHSSQASHSFAASQKNIRLNIEQPVTKCSVAADREQRSLDVCPPPLALLFISVLVSANSQEKHLALQPLDAGRSTLAGRPRVAT